MSESIDHYVWEAFYLKSQYDSKSGRLLASTAEVAKRRIADEADIQNEEWTEKTLSDDQPGFQRWDTQHHIVTVVRQPVYGEVSDR